MIHIIAIDPDREAYELGLPIIRKAGVEHKIDFIDSHGLTILDKILQVPKSEGSYDFAYVDADKENYINYHERLMKLVKVGSLIFYDNTLWRGTVAYSESSLSNTCKFSKRFFSRVEIVKELNKALAADSRIQMTQLPVADGVTIYLKNKTFWTDLTQSRLQTADSVFTVETCVMEEASRSDTTANKTRKNSLLESQELYQYILETSVYPREPGPLKEMREVTANHPWSLMATAPDGGQLMALLLKLIHAKKTIEIGVFTGYSLLLTALVLPEDGKPNSESSSDFAYVDADKENYMNYHERLMKLVKVGGLIVYDNTLWRGTVAYSESSLPDIGKFSKGVLSKVKIVKELNKVLAADSRIQMTQLPVADGVTICMRLY
ncbi:hypothetical protein MRB53_012781 [Persea americana]|uniref:Uncharacterized protein n=1 Tax=Persea americana TaxID=3435 RepID=A0ACC2LYI8_PERAE|nr:hypothetical protein MRB53_012781 [Persea americana]